MRHTQTKPNNKSSDVLTNVKIADTSQKSVGGSKRIGCDLREQGAKKSRKLEISEATNRKITLHKNNVGNEKYKKKNNPPLGKKLIVKGIKKPNEKYKKIGPKIDKKPKKNRKILKKLGRPVDKKEEHEGPPTLCETFSRITTMVAETVINEKENQKLVEGSLAKAKKEFISNDKTKREINNGENSVTKSKGDTNIMDASASKNRKETAGTCETPMIKPKKELSKSCVENKKAKSFCPKNKAGLGKPKAKMKTDRGTKASTVKKFSEKSLVDFLPKIIKEDENSGTCGKGINTRRVSAPGSPENEKEIEVKVDCEKHKVVQSGNISGIKNLNVTKTADKTKSEKKTQALGTITAKRKDNSRTKLESKEKKPKIHNNQSQIKKLVDELRKSLDKDVDLRPQECSSKKVTKKTKVQKTKGKKNKFLLKMNCENSRISRKPVKKNGKMSAKPIKSKMGSETDGSNSDELTLNILQRKAKKYEKNDTNINVSKIKSESTCSNIQEDIKIKVEGKSEFAEKLLGDKHTKNKKIKIEKRDVDEENMSVSEKKIFGEIMKKRSKETESDTDEDLEFKKLLAKKLAKNIEMENSHKIKRKRVENNQSDSEQRARRLRLFGFWSGPKRHRVASLNALAKVHCLYENESKGVMAEIEKMGEILKTDGKNEKKITKKKDRKIISGETKRELEGSGIEKLDSIVINKRTLRGTPGTRGAGKHWDMFAAEFTTSTSCASSDESHSDTDASKRRPLPLLPSYRQKMQKKEENGREEVLKIPKRRRKTDIGITMDLKDMVVRKRMASLNASAILAASYSSEKRSTRKDSSGTSTEDGLSSPDDARVDDRYLSADESDNGNGKKSCAGKSFEVDTGTAIDKSRESQVTNRGEEHKRRKNFWKTKVENLKKASKEKRNSPSPILADFGVERDLSATVMEKEKKDEMNDGREKEKGKGNCKINYTKKYLESNLKVRDKYNDAGKAKSVKERDLKREKFRKEEANFSRKRYAKRKTKNEEIKNINIEKMSDSEKGDEYEYKSDSDNGQRKLIELRNTGGSNKKVAVIVNQDTDVTITGVYVNSTRSTHHEGFCSIAGMQYRISSTSHTQTEATAVLKTSTASEQTPPPTEPTNCSSPRNHKSYTPLSALSNMQPPAGAPPHSHLPPPPPPPHLHHYHHHCSISQHRPPPEHYISHGPPQGPTSPLGRRHGCSSAFSAPHCSSQLPAGNRSSPNREDEGFGHPLPSHGYFQPAGPLIHHHTSNPAVKVQNVSALDLNSAGESQGPGSGNEDISDSTRSGENPPPSSATNHMGYPRGYPAYQGGYYQGGYYPPPPQSSHYQPPPPAFHHYHHPQDFCYPPGYPPSSYPPPATYRRFLQPAPGYFSSEVTYSSSVPPISQDHGAQQMIVPGSPSSSYTAPLDPYPPAAPYYAGYSGSGPACYTHPPSSRNLAFIEQTYQSCPCPMQSCPKNVHIGPLTGECKRPGALPLPPVALQLPQEPPGAAGPPSPARGSAGMPPLPSPVSNSARPNCGLPWDGRVTKSTALEPCSDIKWDETKGRLDVKSKCKSEVLYSESNGMWNPTDIKISNTTRYLRKTDPMDNKWEVLNKEEKNLPPPEAFCQRQGLLAISSSDFSKIPIWNESGMEAESNAKPEDNIKVKAENENISIESPELIKKKNNLSERKRKSTGEDVRKSRKRKKSAEEPMVAAVNVGSDDAFQRSKRKNENLNENTENFKVKNVKKKLATNRKDENELENVIGNTKKSQKNAFHPKPKLLKDRNEAISCDTVSEVIEQVIKGQMLRKKKKSEEVIVVSDKISNRRRSNQEKWTVLLAENHCPRKSRSCSPNGSIRTREKSNSPWRSTREDLKRRTAEQSGSKATKNGRTKTETKSRERNGQEHSKTSKSSKKNSGASIMSKTKNGVSILGKSSQGVGCLTPGTKSKRSKCDSSTSTSSKKFHVTKMLSTSPRSGISPKWSNGWSWDSDSFDAKVYLTNDEAPVMRKCYSAMRHVEGDVIQPKDCILLKAGPRKIDLPFVAKVAALWENPDDGEMMVSLLWYYRPEHTDQGRQSSDQQDEIFASRHKDINSVACIEDKCFVLTYNEYCRYRKKAKRMEEGIVEKNLHVPLPEQPYPRLHRQPPCVMAPDMVFFCRRVYDFRQKRLLKNPT